MIPYLLERTVYKIRKKIIERSPPVFQGADHGIADSGVPSGQACPPGPADLARLACLARLAASYIQSSLAAGTEARAASAIAFLAQAARHMPQPKQRPASTDIFFLAGL
jgi:hypothetical protein